MKKAFEKFAELNYNFEDFFVIRFIHERLYLQGDANAKKIAKYAAMGYNFEIDAVNGWLQGELLMDDLMITITLHIKD
jgi:hypothetical protein